jgi:uncharacterized protein (DUF433 family)
MPACSESRTHLGTHPKKWRFGYTAPLMARRKVARTQDDVREYPAYSIEEAARYVGVPARTMRSWVRGYPYKTAHGIKHVPPLIQPADSTHNLLSFFNLAEAHVLAATREKNIPTSRVRRAVEYLRNVEQLDRPLLTHVFHRHGRNLFVKELFGRRLRQPLGVSAYGQYGINQVLRRYLERVERDKIDGRPILIYPLRRGQRDRRKRIAIYPLVSSGKPVLRGTGIPIEVIWARVTKGHESIPALARDFRLKRSDVKAAIRHFQAA